jgi:hypothetical protein
VWVYGPGWDIFMAFSWVPVFCLSHVLISGSGPSSADLLREGVVLALLVSFLHQPLTFGLVYCDPQQFALHRRLFVIAPVVAVAVALWAAVSNLSVVIPVAALWNLQHTLQQRYGLQRIYAAKSGYGSARLDRAVAYVPMAAALFAVAAMPRITELVQRSGLDPMNARAVALLVRLRPASAWLLVAALVATAVVMTALLRQEWLARPAANPAKWLYQLSSLALVASLVFDPAAGFIAYVSAHSVEYAVVVYRTAERRYGRGEDAGRQRGLLQRVGRNAPGRIGFFGLIVLGAFAIHNSVHGVAFNAVLYSVGALHFTYDAFIWKLRKPAVARDFAVVRQTAPAAPAS